LLSMNSFIESKPGGALANQYRVFALGWRV